MPNIVQITPCNDWFYYADCNDSHVFEPVAAWALLSDGSVVGLINDFLEASATGGAKLVPASANGELIGEYLHANQLNDMQKGWVGS